MVIPEKITFVPVSLRLQVHFSGTAYGIPERLSGTLLYTVRVWS